MNKVVLLLGSNLFDRVLMLEKARNHIRISLGAIKKESQIYESAPWGFNSDNSFLNQTLIVETQLKPIEILGKIKIVEKKLGRVKQSVNYESRTIDIDILFYNDEIINLPNLIIPHPQLHKRKFTLVPLAEIDPILNHPVFNKSILDLLHECNDQSIVYLFR